MNNKPDNNTQHHSGSGNSYSRITAEARRYEEPERDESAPPFFAARVAALAMAEQRAKRKPGSLVPVSLWNTVGYRALAAAFIVSLGAVLAADVDFEQLATAGNGLGFWTDEPLATQLSYFAVDVM